MPAASIIQQLPPEIATRLRGVVRRVRMIQALKGTLAVGAAFVFSLIAAMAVDWAFDIRSPGMRWGLSLAVAAITGFSLWFWLLRPLARQISLISVARWVETHHPEMEERISTAVELSGRGDAGSQSLIEEVIREAVMDAGKLNPKTELGVKAARKPLCTAGAAVALLAALFACFPSITPILFKRALAPHRAFGNAHSADVRYLTADGQVVIAGDSFNVEAAYKAPREQRAVIVLTYPDGTEVREQMTEDSGLEVKSEERGIGFRFPTQPPAASP